MTPLAASWQERLQKVLKKRPLLRPAFDIITSDDPPAGWSDANEPTASPDPLATNQEASWLFAKYVNQHPISVNNLLRTRMVEFILSISEVPRYFLLRLAELTVNYPDNDTKVFPRVSSTSLLGHTSYYIVVDVARHADERLSFSAGCSIVHPGPSPVQPWIGSSKAYGDSVARFSVDTAQGVSRIETDLPPVIAMRRLWRLAVDHKDYLTGLIQAEYLKSIL